MLLIDMYSCFQFRVIMTAATFAVKTMLDSSLTQIVF